MEQEECENFVTEEERNLEFITVGDEVSIGKMYFVQFDGFEEKKYNLKEVVRAPQAL